MDETIYLIYEMWIKRILALLCISTYFIFYFILFRQNKRLQHKIYWLQCQISIGAILCCLCALVSGFYYHEYMLLFDDESMNFNSTSVKMHILEQIRDLTKLFGLLNDINDFGKLTWNAFALLTLYQYYYDLKRAFDMEKFTVRNALFTLCIWFVMIAFNGVFYVIYKLDIGGYLLFWSYQSISDALLYALHMLALLVLIGLTVKLHRNGLTIDLLPNERENENFKSEYILDAKWRRKRFWNFVLIYILTSALIVSDILKEISCVHLIVRSTELKNSIDHWFRRVADCLWFIEAIAWPCLGVMNDGSIKKRFSGFAWITRKMVISENDLNEMKGNPKKDVVVVIPADQQ